MQLRRAVIADMEQLKALYFNTILAVNSKDYSKIQVNVWASTADRTESLLRRIQEQNFYVAFNDEELITGFASLENNGYLDMMYVHKDFQRMGIATLLICQIFETAKKLNLTILTTEASITARPFFEKHGFVVLGEQVVYIKEIPLSNYRMQCALI
ncbi:MAG TPA: GNAT family N-acetyltransferase [Panacibacter sp.]|nr:GNAT family N-acetyltransferase [Panacibacter sp.]HNP43225.1 GNAT family N-acetyltransferase [Panacibacter sp.]